MKLFRFREVEVEVEVEKGHMVSHTVQDTERRITVICPAPEFRKQLFQVRVTSGEEDGHTSDIYSSTDRCLGSMCYRSVTARFGDCDSCQSKYTDLAAQITEQEKHMTAYVIGIQSEDDSVTKHPGSQRTS